MHRPDGRSFNSALHPPRKLPHPSDMEATAMSTPSVFDVRDRRVLVTGASRGIGRAIAVGFAHAGAHVVGAARSESDLQETGKHCTDAPGSFEYVSLDLRAPESVQACVQRSVEILGGLDVLVNNAAD